MVADELAKRGMSIRSLAAATDIPFVTLTRRLNPTALSPLNTSELASIASALDVRPSDLIVAAEATPGLSTKSA